VVLRGDGGGMVGVPRRPVAGAERVGKVLRNGFRRYLGAAAQLVSVNGGAGMAITMDGRVIAMVALAVADGRVTEIDAVFNPDKLERLQG
jgi:RNA polymerase sigma-70 factor (ECF subfamily)